VSTDPKDSTGWPLVAINDDGIRPAGPPNECLYCRRTVGQPHGPECVIVEKRVKVRYLFEIDISVPHHWSKSNVEFHRNQGTWCADNAIAELQALTSQEDKNGVSFGPCLCGVFTYEYVQDVDTTPTRNLRDPFLV
jgi:hypothetical protein